MSTSGSSPCSTEPFRTASGILDAETVPELFVMGDPSFNAWCVGMDKPFILVNSGLVDLMDEDELRWVLAHELGHAMSGHAIYRTILDRLLKTTRTLGRRSDRRPRGPRHTGRPDGVATQVGALRRPGRAARDAGPGLQHPAL